MKANQINSCRFLFLLLITVFCACKKSFLEIEPKKKLVATTASDYNLLLNNNKYVVNADGQVYMGDEVTTTAANYSAFESIRDKRYFEYKANIYEANEDGTEVKDLLSQLYVFNKVAGEVMNATGDEQDKASYRAEALTNRAWIYFMLVNYYGKPYNEASSTTDLAFPIITVADVTQTKFARATVAEVYSFIINDLKTAIPDLALSKGIRVRVTKAAAEALLGKVYLFMGKYSDALIQMNNAFEHLPTGFTMALADYNSTLAIGGSWGYDPVDSPFDVIFGEMDIAGNTEVLFAKQQYNFNTSTDANILLSPAAYSLYGVGDQRLKLYSPYAAGGDPIVTPGVYRKIGVLNNQIGMTLPDMYLIRAEVKARTGDLTGAKADLETLRKKRMPATAASVNISNATAMIKFVIDERIREFALQGYRWFDMRRLSVDPIFSGASYSHQILSETGTVVSNYPLSLDRMTLKIPQKIIDANPGMTNNP